MDHNETKCFLDFWNSFSLAMSQAGGNQDLNSWKDKTLYELALVLSQNGIRFKYDKEGVLE